MNKLAPSTLRHAPPGPIDPMLKRSISSLIRFTPTDGGPCDLAAEPDADLRREAHARVVVVQAHLERFDPDAVRLAITGLLAMYARARNGEDEVGLVISGYMSALRDLPAFAVLQACSNWSKGDAPGQRPGNSPTSDELRSAALAVMRPWRQEVVDLNRVLNGRVVTEVTDEERARVAERMTALNSQMAAKDAEMARASRELHTAHIARGNELLLAREHKQAGTDPNKDISPGLASILERWRDKGKLPPIQRQSDAA